MKTRKILFIHMAGLGDAIMASAGLAAFKTGNPDVKVSVLCRAQVAGYLRRLPFVDEVICFPGSKRIDRRRPWLLVLALPELIRLMFVLYQTRFDGVAQWRGQFVDFLLASATLCRRRVLVRHSYIRRPIINPRLFSWLYRRVIDGDKRATHLVEIVGLSLGALTEEMGGTALDAEPAPLLELQFPLSRAEAEASLRLLQVIGIEATDRMALLCISSRTKSNIWAGDRFAEVARHLRDRHGLRVVIDGLPEQEGLMREIMSQAGPGIYSTGGRSSLVDLAGIIRRSTIVVTYNSAPLHIASALKTPVIVLNGRDGSAMNPWGTRSIVVTRNPYFPRRHPDRSQWPTLVQRISVEDVTDAIDRLLYGAETANSTRKA